MPSPIRLLAVALALSACSGGAQAGPAGAGRYAGNTASGLASWYGDELAGSRTASGTPFDPDAITAAHRTLPLGSYAEVTSVDTGRRIVVLINDRGPGRRDRIIDLSRGAAQQLGFGRRSIATVTVRPYSPTLAEATALLGGRAAPLHADGNRVVRAASDDLRRPSATLDPSRRYQLQIASFSNESRARALADVLDADVVTVGSLYRVRIGPLAAKDVQHARDAVAARGYGDAQILPAD